MDPNPELSTVGIFDSGVGGLSVLRAVWNELPGQPSIYLGDQAHVPYGPRPLAEVRTYAHEITRRLIESGAGLVVVACNAASAAALHELRRTFPETPIVGMEPAVKPAAEHTRSGVVGVLATPATFQGELYASVIERFAGGVHLIQHTCPGLVACIEAGQVDAPETRRILADALQPMLAEGIDTIVLGCTHYPFVIPCIERIAGPAVRVIDPAPAVARRVRQQLQAAGLHASSLTTTDIRLSASRTRFITTDSPQAMQRSLRRLLGVEAIVERWRWQGDSLVGG